MKTRKKNRRLVVAMAEAGSTAGLLATATGRSRITIGSILNGRHRPRRITALRIASVLGKSVDELFGGPEA